MTKYRNNIDYPRRPLVISGNLYYVRMSTRLGIMYKLGFTTLNTVDERFSFKNNGDEKFVDFVLFFIKIENAWDVEQRIHKYYKEKALFNGMDERMPFFKNGQSELYAEDILDMDPNYTLDQARQTRLNIDIDNYKSFGASEEKCQEFIEAEKNRYEMSLEAIRDAEAFKAKYSSSTLVRLLKLILSPVVFIIDLLLKKYDQPLFSTNVEKDNQMLELFVRLRAANYVDIDNARIERQAKVTRLMRELNIK